MVEVRSFCAAEKCYLAVCVNSDLGTSGTWSFPLCRSKCMCSCGHKFVESGRDKGVWRKTWNSLEGCLAVAVFQSWENEWNEHAWGLNSLLVLYTQTWLALLLLLCAYFQTLHACHGVNLVPFLGETKIQYVCVAFDTKEKIQEENCHPVPKPESRVEVCNLSPCPPR